MGVLPGAEPFAADGGDVGVLLSHGLWPLVAADLPAVTAPVLLLRSRVDHVVEPLSGRLLRAGITGAGLTEVILEEPYHVATLHDDAPLIFDRSLDFVRARTTSPAGS